MLTQIIKTQIKITQQFQLPTGTLQIKTDSEQWSFADLCEIAVRRNPKRGFLFVSKVLGRHIPVVPPVMNKVWSLLATKLDPAMQGPVVFVGLCETATALGLGVFEHYATRTGREDLVFFQTTRHRLRAPLLCSFEEEHSHATQHFLFYPEDPQLAHQLHTARSLVIVDDEISTGRTFNNLVAALKGHIPTLQRLTAVAITDWSGGIAQEHLTQLTGLPTDCSSLLSGTYIFTPHPHAPTITMPRVVGNDLFTDTVLCHHHGRCGLKRAPKIPHEWLHRLPWIPHGRHRVLVLGTSEFTYLPALLGQSLAERGYDVRCQAVSRSPIIVGGAIRNVIEGLDNYGEGIPHYLYNFDPDQYDTIFICFETVPATVHVDFVQSLHAQALFIP